MSSPIERLPVELVDLIVAHFSLPDYQNVRLASKQVCHLTLYPFRNRYFIRRTTTLALPALDRLLDVSKCRHLADSVSVLRIKILDPDELSTLQEITRVGIWPPPKRFPRVTSCSPEHASQEVASYVYLMSTDEPKAVSDRLSRATRRFTKLKAVRLFVNDRTVNCIFTPTTDSASYPRFLRRSFNAVITAVVKSDVQIGEFQTLAGARLRSKTQLANIVYSAFNFSKDQLSALSTAFSSLRVLTLTFGTLYDGVVYVPGWEHKVSNFINAATSLEELTLCFEPCHYIVAAMQSIAQSVRLPSLKHFYLWGARILPADLIHFTKFHSFSLRCMHIRSCFLSEGTWAAVLNSFLDLNLDYLRLAGLVQAPRFSRDVRWISSKDHKTKTRAKLVEGAGCKSLKAQLTEIITSLIEFNQLL
jgi:hypothetical protein